MSILYVSPLVSAAKLKSLTTQYQVNQMMTKYSVQILIASDAMSVANGSTECVPCSHQMNNLDVAILEPDVKAKFEKVKHTLPPRFSIVQDHPSTLSMSPSARATYLSSIGAWLIVAGAMSPQSDAIH